MGAGVLLGAPDCIFEGVGVRWVPASPGWNGPRTLLLKEAGQAEGRFHGDTGGWRSRRQNPEPSGSRIPDHTET